MSKTITVQPSWNNGASNIQFTNGVTFNKKPEEETRCCMTCCGCCCDDDSGGPAGSYGYTNNFSSDSPSNFIGGDSDVYTGGYGGGDDGGGGGCDSGGGYDSGGGGCDSGGGGCDSGGGGCDSGGVD